MGRETGVKCMGKDFNNCDMDDDDAGLILCLRCFLNHFSSASSVDVDVEDLDLDWMVLI